MYAEILNKNGNLPCIICDKDHVVSVAGIPKKELLDRRISPVLEEAMQQRKSLNRTDKSTAPIKPIEGIDRYALATGFINVDADICGAVIFLSGDSTAVATELQVKLADISASLLAKQLEN